jgi:hypothetical protein
MFVAECEGGLMVCFALILACSEDHPLMFAAERGVESATPSTLSTISECSPLQMSPDSSGGGTHLMRPSSRPLGTATIVSRHFNVISAFFAC